MGSLQEVVVATVCMHVTYDKQTNVLKYKKFLDQAVRLSADLVVFPEQSVQGYLPGLNRRLAHEDIQYQIEHAEVVPEGVTTRLLIDFAKEYGIHIVYGLTERHSLHPDILYNTAVLISPRGYVGKYRKTHLPGDEAHVYYAGTELPVFDTPLGRIGLLICYDKVFPEVSRQLVLRGADLLVMPTAWPAERNSGDGDKSEGDSLYTIYERVRAAENSVYFVSSNQVGVCGETEYHGCSQIINPSGTVVTSTGRKEGVVKAVIRASELSTTRLCDVTTSHLKSRRPELYTFPERER